MVDYSLGLLITSILFGHNPHTLSRDSENCQVFYELHHARCVRGLAGPCQPSVLNHVFLQFHFTSVIASVIAIVTTTTTSSTKNRKEFERS